MALTNYIMSNLLGRDWWDSWDFPARIMDQHFGMGLASDDLLVPRYFPAPMRCPVHPAVRELARQGRSGGASEVVSQPDKFQIKLDVQHFQPDEIEVKTVGNSVVIHGKHEERTDEHGFVSREFTRRYMLPEGVEPESVASCLTTDGILSIEAPRKKPQVEEKQSRVVPIQMKPAETPAVEGAKPEQ